MDDSAYHTPRNKQPPKVCKSPVRKPRNKVYNINPKCCKKLNFDKNSCEKKTTPCSKSEYPSI